MLNGKKRTVEENLKAAFESGYSNAAGAFSKMFNDKIYFNNFQFGFRSIESIQLRSENSFNSFNRNGGTHLITTEIFGDVTGKSYLLISDQEFDSLTKSVPPSKNNEANLKEEFIKELDNILSASVISRLSSSFDRKMYGDIPCMIGKVNGHIEDIIYDDFSEQAEEVYINSIFFSFENQPTISPFFIWVIDSQSIKVPEHKPA